MPRISFTGLLILIVALQFGCSKDDNDSRESQSASTAKVYEGELPLTGSWLGERLPERALVYYRLPNPAGMFSAPKGNALNDALGRLDAHVRNLIKIREGLITNVLDEFDELNDIRLRLVFQYLRSPVEIAVLGPDKHSNTLSLLATFTLDLADNERFEQIVSELLEALPGVALQDSLDDKGFAQLTGLPFPIILNFDAASGRVAILAGPGTSLDKHQARLASLSTGGVHPMYPLQKDIDESGQGHFLWANPKGTMQFGQMFIPLEIGLQLQESGLNEIDSLALGFGVANRKGRLRLAMNLPDVPAREFVPVIANDLKIKSVGAPDMLLLMSIPTPEYFLKIEKLITAGLEEEQTQQWTDLKATMNTELGLSFEELLGALGPEMVLILDDVGDYFAIRLRDQATWDKIVAAINAKTGRSVSQHKHKGEKIHHWTLPSIYSFADTEAMSSKAGPVSMLARLDEHIYWVREGDFLFISQIPQPLMDRIETGADTSIDSWLRDTQRQDVTQSVLAISARTNKLPRRFYYGYLEILQTLADIAKADYDPWSLPTAAQLAMPTTGAIGFSINLGDPVLSVEMLFENNPIEGLLSGSSTGIAAVGILAAIAIPAYQDYTLRAEIGYGLHAAAQIRTAIAEVYGTHGRFPNAQEIAQLQMSIPEADDSKFAVEVDPDTGVIVISFFNEQLGEEAELRQTPRVEDGRFSFDCTSNITNKYLPRSCQ